jgi:UDP-N-acetylmuramoyl-L-alanyl-D-glutamate--2,6-diaminopimelate ligase
MRLSELLRDVQPLAVHGATDIEVGAVTCDSRAVRPGDVFVAIRGGQEEDRHRYVPAAVAAGAGAIVVEDETEAGAAVRVRVASCRQALAALAARFYGHPGRQLELVGVTGTKGKTTTALLIRQVYEAAGRPCGYLGTLGCITSAEQVKQANTTPEASELQRLLRWLADSGQRAAVLEVSSHGLVLERVAGLQFRVAVFTNLGRDHLDFHGTTEAYFAAKARLFEQLTSDAAAVVNLDDPMAAALLGRTRAAVTTFGCQAPAHVRVASAQSSAQGTHLVLSTPSGTLAVATPLVGSFNVSNTLAAVAVGLAAGLPPAAVARGAGALSHVPGRFERVCAGQPFEVIVDYAHNPDSLQNVLTTARGLTTGRLICVFGCGGNRDRGKRPQMGRIAAELADVVVLTSDNPRHEEPRAIIDEIAAGVPAATTVAICPDRREAIASALAGAAAGDLVLIAGKGHETVQLLGDRAIPFDDRDVVRQILAGTSAAGPGGC